MKLYHGSNQIIENPLHNGSRDKTDFGKGFYLTANDSQAFMAGIKTEVKRHQRKQYTQERFIEDIREEIENGFKS